MLNLNVRPFNLDHLMSRTNETTHIEWHETCKCKCSLDGSVCNNKHYLMINADVNARS